MSDEVKEQLRAAMDEWLHDDDWRAGLAAIIGGESGFVPKWEASWRHSANDRIRRFFARRVASLTDEQLNELKSDDRRFFDYIYGLQFNHIHHLGQRDAGDGYNFRGGGLIQLTGRANYAKYGALANVDLVGHPANIVDDPKVSCAVAVAYFLDRFHGGDFAAMKRAVGVSVGEPDEEKNRLYAQYRRTGEWNYAPTTVQSAGRRILRLEVPPLSGNDVRDLQTKLAAAGCLVNRIDGVFGRRTEDAVRQFQSKFGLRYDGIVGPEVWKRLGP